jgi:hypothetical protein
MAERYVAPSVRQLAAVVERIAPRDRARWDEREKVPGAGGVPVRVSRSRADQLWMVVGMFDRAVGREEMPGRAGRSVAQLFTWAALGAFWDLAVDGQLHYRARDVGRRLPLATQRVVRDCLVMLAGLVVPGKALRLPRLPSPPARATTTRGQEKALLRYLSGLASSSPPPRTHRERVSADVLTRSLAMTGVVLDTRSRVGELAAQRVEHLGLAHGSLWVRRRPQNGVHLEPVDVEIPLSEFTRAALRRWMPVRDRVVSPLTGGKGALWVTLVPAAGRPAGMPLQGKTLTRSYARGVQLLNAVMAGREGWEPLPTRVEAARRAWMPPEEKAVREELEEQTRLESLPARPVGRPRLPQDRPLAHGRVGTYTNRGCRCSECREAATNVRRAQRQEARQRSGRRRV